MIEVGNAPCSWGSLEFAGVEGEAIGYAQMLDELVETGYAGTELGDWGYMPTDARTLHGELVGRNVTLLGAFVPVALKDARAHASGQAQALKTARLLADVAQCGQYTRSPFLVLADENGRDPARTRNAGRVGRAMALGDEQARTFARAADEIARAVHSETGLRTVFHHHCAGYVETPDEIARLLDRTDPDRLGLAFDTGHFLYGSGTADRGVVLEGLDRFADRIWYLHFKDCHPAIAETARRDAVDYFEAMRRGVFCELGQSAVDFSAVLRWADQRGYEDWILVEQDVLPGMGRPKESAARNRTYLRTLGI